MPKYSDLSSIGLIFQLKKKLNQFKAFLKKALSPEGYTTVRMIAKVREENNRQVELFI